MKGVKESDLTPNDRAEVEKFREFIGRVGPLTENPTREQARVYFEMYEPNAVAPARPQDQGVRADGAGGGGV